MITGGGKFIVSTEVKWYEKYIGFPFLMFGSNPNTGIDCGNLIKYVYKQDAGTLKHGWEKVTTPDIFNVITLTIGATNCTNHCALYVAKNRILQTMTEHESWIAPYGRYYQQYTTGIYKWNPIHIQI